MAMTKTTSIVREFDPGRVLPLPGQPRQRFRGIPELAASIKEVGQATVGQVTLIENDPDFDAQLVDGERRLRACRVAGVKFRAEVVQEPKNKDNLFVASWTSNFGKQDHDNIEIALGLKRLQEMGLTQLQMAKISGKSICWVSQHLSLLSLDPEVQALLIPGESEESRQDEEVPEESFDQTKEKARNHLPFSIALLLIPLPPEVQRRFAKKIVEEGLSMVTARRLVLRELRLNGMERNPSRHESSKNSLAAIEAAIEQFSDRIGVFLDMPRSQIDMLIDNVDNTEKKRIADLLRDLVADNALAMAKAIEARIPKLKSA